jgi:hypothetical protein
MIPPVNRSPLVTRPPCRLAFCSSEFQMLRQDAAHQAKEKSVIETHNTKYKAKAAAYQSSHEGVRVFAPFLPQLVPNANTL